MRRRKNKRLNYRRTITLIISGWSAKLLRKGSGNFEHFPSVACTWLSFVSLRQKKFCYCSFEFLSLAICHFHKTLQKP